MNPRKPSRNTTDPASPATAHLRGWAPLALWALATAAAGPAFAATSTLQFQQGLNGYAGAIDTQVRGADPTVNYGADAEIGVDASDGGAQTQALIRFDSLFGSAPGQIAPGDTIVAATLALNITSGGSGFLLHEMLQAWDANSITWNSAAGGIQANGVEAAVAPLLSVGANEGGSVIPGGIFTFDFTAPLLRLQAGQGGSLGWALLPWLPDGTNGLDWYSADWVEVGERPLLTVQVSPIPEPRSVALMLAGVLLLVVAMRSGRR